jgi:beta-galactosidase
VTAIDPGADAVTTLGRRTFLKLASASAALAAARPTLGFATDIALATSPRRSRRLDAGWRFHLGHAAEMEMDFGFGRYQRTYAKAGAMTADAARADFDDSGWAPVQVPHDWAVALPFAPPPQPLPKETADAIAAHGFKAIGRDFPANSVGWYRLALDIDPADRERRTWLEFDGVFRDCLVFVNGYIVGRNDSGYAPFRVDIGDFLNYDGSPNQLAVRADASLGEGWFYEGAGIYRNVRLVTANPVHVPQWGTFVRSEISAAGARILISAELVNEGEADAEVTLRHELRSPDDTVVARLPEWRGTVARGQRITRDDDVQLPSPRRWSIETPQMYTLVTEVRVAGALVDRYETPFGIRSIRFDPEQGFFLNDQPVKLLGTCNHHDHAGVGTAIPDRLHAWRVEQLQAMGSNAWRSAHNPPAEALLDACDALGMLMIAEARLNSSAPEAIDQLERMVRRDRNHPCVILWSVGNEEPHQGTERGARISEDMVRAVRALDPTRPTTQAFDNHFTEGATRAVDVIGFNYRTDQMEKIHRQVPGKSLLGTETGSTVSTRGAYFNDADRHVVRAYDTEFPWWASTAEAWWRIADAHPFVAGGFIWTGFDYRGEPTPYAQWPSISSYFGVLDTCGFPKDNYWYYRAWWRPAEPLVHLLPHWTWPGRDGQPIEVWAYSSCEEVELFVAGHSAGRKRVERDGHLAWLVPYAPGAIKAVGYDKGRKTAVAERRTAGKPHAIALSADRRRIAADGRDLSMLRAEIVDKAGTPVPDSDALVTFDISGPGRIIGVGNGDPTSAEADQGTQRKAFHGLCQAIVQSRGGSGAIRIRARSDGLRDGEANLIAMGGSGA